MEEQVNSALNNDEVEVLKTLTYFDIFSYPLTSKEIKDFFGGVENNNGNVDVALDSLSKKKLVFQLDNFYSLKADKNLSAKRSKGNKLAEPHLKKAKKISKFIGAFPFVRGVFISGSLSKGYMGDDADIDYFIITKPNRLWLARTLLILYKKVFLLNSRKYFCVNYFVDENNLEIEEKNRFTATELVTLIPTYNANIFERLKQQNQWVKNYFPHHQWNSNPETPSGKPKLLKRLLEFLLSRTIGNWLDRAAMKVTLIFWKRKFEHFTDEQFDLALKSRNYVSKHHPQNFQSQVLLKFEEKINSFLKP